MNKFSVICFVLLSLCFLTQSLENDTSENYLTKALNSLDDEAEKEEFLKYALGRGILNWAKNQARLPKFIPSTNEETFLDLIKVPQNKIKKFQKLDVPDKSTAHLLKWTIEKFHLNRKEVLELIKAKCKGPQCVTLKDIGALCCPW